METQVKLAIVAIIVIIPGLSFVVWNTDQSETVETSNEKITVLASFYPLYDFTKIIGGEKIDVSILVRDGIEPHDWDPSIRDIESMQNADLIVINGIGFENWIEKFSEINIDTKIVDTSFGISILNNLEEHNEHEEEHNEHEEHILGDPHIWLNPVLVKTQVQNISTVLQELDPENAFYYQINADNYILKLDILDKKIHTELSSCKTDFINYHNAFSYFANQYGLNQHTIVSSNDPHAEPTPRTFQNIIELAKELDIDVVFTEEGIDQRTLEVISKEIDGRILILSPIEIGQENSDYIQRMEKNLSNLKEALC